MNPPPNGDFGNFQPLLDDFVEAMLRGGYKARHMAPDTPKATDCTAAAKLAADTAKMQYDAFIKVGFTPVQAFSLLKILLNNAKRGN
ncbi:hypothetical protein [Acutalibacter caecimuris]|uniref:hypothetical protein n=1 Tax=Acutalibacter caecimuris TaxID=3093657 RepID=UPI002AC8D8AC|nr:hypothetical protein [Acutalibacter sp. M00118]